MTSPFVLPRPLPASASLRPGRLRSWIVLTVTAACLAGPGIAALKTPTGKPEVTIRGATRGAIFDAIADQMLSSDFLLKGRSENTAVFAKRRAIFLAENVTEYRVIYNLIDTPAGVRVMAAMVQFVYANTPREKLDVDFSRHPKSAPGIQAILEYVKATLEATAARAPAADRSQALAALEKTVEPNARCAVTVVGLEIEGSKIVVVVPDGPAARAGLQPDDVLVSIDGEPATTSVQNGSRLNGRSDTSVLLKVRRGDREMKIPVIREKSAP